MASRIFLLLVVFCQSQGKQYDEKIQKWADELETDLVHKLDRLTGLKELEKSYFKFDNAKLMSTDGSNLVRTMAEELASSFHAKTQALQKLVDVAENSLKNYMYNANLKLSDVSWVSVKEFQEEDNRLVYSDKFKRKVNLTYSASHVPLEIYEGYPDILNVVQWSASLDQTFQENLHQYPDIHWQYFGSQTGLMRIYPAMKWKVYEDALDLFDVRQRSWYVHGLTSPKDIVIMMDTSGSMYGQTMAIMRTAVEILLQSLGENDYVNVAWFRDKVGWVSCFDTLVQANDRNKKILQNGVKSMMAGQMASLSRGLEFAFEHLAKFQGNRSESWLGAECHQVIALFSDGGTEEAWDVVLKWNKDKHVRIFTYAVGPHPVPFATLKELACLNRGLFTQITGLVSIRTKVQEYLKVLSRPIVYSGERNFQWSNFYLDSMGLGLMTTLTLPIFNRTDKHNQSVVGVMGLDITLQELMKKEPKYQMGPTGYSFSINRNGHVAFHPHFLSRVPEDFLDDAPLLDLLELEFESPAMNELRQAMVDRRVGEQQIAGLVRLPGDQDHLARAVMNYYYTPLNGSSFSLAVAIPEERKQFVMVKGLSTAAGVTLQKNDILAPWKYCPPGESLSLTIQTELHRCDESLLQRLLWDLKKTEDLLHYWHTDRSKWGDLVHSAFLMTEGGLTRVFPPEEKWLLRPQSNPDNSSYFASAMLREPGYNFLLVQSEENDTGTLVAAVRHVMQHQIKLAVAGVHLRSEWFHANLIRSKGGKQICSNPEELLCYVLDDGGFILASNLPDTQVGQFLGVYDPELMRQLLYDNIFDRVTEYNFEARCPKEKYVSAGLRSLNVPTLFGSWEMGWIFDPTAWAQLRFWIWGLVTSLLANVAGSWSITAEMALELTDVRRCTTLRAIYFPGNNSRDFSGYVECGNCSRWFGGSQLEDMNLFVVGSEPRCPLSELCPRPPLIQAPIEDPGPRECQPTTRYRRRPDRCYKDYKDEGETECSSAGRGTSAWLMILIGGSLFSSM